VKKKKLAGRESHRVRKPGASLSSCEPRQRRRREEAAGLIMIIILLRFSQKMAPNNNHFLQKITLLLR
jgi:hypothetical protein